MIRHTLDAREARVVTITEEDLLEALSLDPKVNYIKGVAKTTNGTIEFTVLSVGRR